MIKKNLRSIVANLSRYPSGDNAQPFLFKIDENQRMISIIHDEKIARHLLNPGNICSVISLGMIVQLMENMSQKYNFKYKFTLLIEEDRIAEVGQKLWGKFELDALPLVELPLDIFYQVKTYRGLYLKDPIEMADYRENILPISDFTEEELKLIAKSDAEQFRSFKFLVNVFHWIHFSKKKYFKLRAGFHYSELNMNIFESFLIPFVKIMPIAFIISRFSMVRNLVYRKSLRLMMRTPVFFGVIYPLKNKLDLIEVGKIGMQFKIAAAERGGVTQPMSSLTIPYILKNKYNIQMGDGYQMNESLYSLIFNKFCLKNVKHQNCDVVWVMRVGFPDRHLPPAMRRDLDTIVIN